MMLSPWLPATRQRVPMHTTLLSRANAQVTHDAKLPENQHSILCYAVSISRMLEQKPIVHKLFMPACCTSAKHSFPMLFVFYVTILGSRKCHHWILGLSHIQL
jgi:hypothetical protein